MDYPRDHNSQYATADAPNNVVFTIGGLVYALN